ncbi:probable receptor-like protein kinase At5g20050 [Mercurialis annua]|uniref:probable receptor-like protein kinase At5g20050 n=1 Tax=Mercurialis annua TaxID=3986 RepID=UPI0024AF686F|nr:probable receptor-like protein kinase At5g20050 [Mercurialis annua]
MEDKRVHIIAASTVIILVIIIVICRVSLKLSKPFYLIAGADIALILAIFSCLIIRRRYTLRSKSLVKRLASEGRELRIEYSFLRKVAGVPIKFRYRELEEATDNFQALIGQGASASVFKGILSDGTAVAVKRINREERGEKEFRSEVAAIASVQHTNLVRLIGYCVVTGGPRFLVYEYMANGSLDSWIFPRKPNRNNNLPGGCLSWELRYRVAVDVAKALSYLHHDCRSRVLHLDVKPENILIDENYRAIVSDLGLSKLMQKDESRVITNIRGTRGYLAPEWLLGLGISEKSDVYSYGMVILEIIGGQRNVKLIQNEKSQTKWQYFPRIVHRKLKEGKIMEIVDERLIESGMKIEEREVKRLVNVALWCIQEKPRIRPTMDKVVEMLEGRVVVEEPPETQMIVVDLLSIDRDTGDGGNRAAIAAFGSSEQEDGSADNHATSCSYAMSIISPR